MSVKGPAIVPVIPLVKAVRSRKLMSAIKKELVNRQLSLSCLYGISLRDVKIIIIIVIIIIVKLIINCILQVCAINNSGNLSKLDDSSNELHSCGLDLHFQSQLALLCRELMLQKLEKDIATMQNHIKEGEKETLIVVNTLETIFKSYKIRLPPPWENKHTFVIDDDAIAKDDLDFVLSAADSTLAVTQALQPTNQGFYENSLSLTSAVNGMTFCLVMQDSLFMKLQARSDREYSLRLQAYNRQTIQIMDDMREYRHALLSYIHFFPEAKQTPIYQSFHNLFPSLPDSEVVLYYCSCLIERTPATIYLTHSLLCTHVHSLLGGGPKEIMNLKDIDALPSGITIVKSTSSLSGKSNYFNFDYLKISFSEGAKTLNLSPVVIDWYLYINN